LQKNNKSENHKVIYIYIYSQNKIILYYQLLYNISTTCFGHYLAIIRLY